MHVAGSTHNSRATLGLETVLQLHVGCEWCRQGTTPARSLQGQAVDKPDVTFECVEKARRRLTAAASVHRDLLGGVLYDRSWVLTR